MFANDFPYHEPIHGCMAWRTEFIMADATSKYSIATGSYNIAISFVMNASTIFWLWQNRSWRRSNLSSVSTHEILNLHALFLVTQGVVTHDGLNSSSSSYGRVFFDRFRDRISWFLVVHVLAVVVIIVIDTVISFQVIITVIHVDVVIIHVILRVCHCVGTFLSSAACSEMDLLYYKCSLSLSV
jgi:hypothetical protein